ncbi:MAG: chemotaxis protein CheA, partial [Candidatus Hydrothermarchaeaceae archaeon]
MDEIIDDFITETDELIEAVDSDLIALENSPNDLELINKIFRNFHTIKGAAGFLGYTKIVAVVHNSESILNRCRQGEIQMTSRISDVILKAVDALKILMENVRNREEPTIDVQPLLNDLQECIESPEKEGEPTEKSLEETQEIPTDTTKDISLFKLGQMLVKEEMITNEQLEDALEDQDKQPKLGEILVEKKFITKRDLKDALKKQAKPEAVKKDQTIRVDVERLDDVLNLVGELILGRNRLLQFTSELEQEYGNDPKFQGLLDTTRHINMVSSDLQLSVMRTRMQPIKRVFSKFPRMVRDMAKSLNKEINLEIVGEDTELDKSVIEEIADPLVHLIRNAIDHGIEDPKVREAAGKPKEGKLKLSAFHEGNNIVIEIKDDGKGLNPEKIAEKAVATGFTHPSDLEHMSDRDKVNLIFAPGFSTVEIVSDISGRGVGLDVVKSNVTKFGGSVNIISEPGRGALFSVRFPLTVAIINTLMVGVGNETFALPLEAVVETVRILPDSIQKIDMQDVIRLREEVLPLLHMSDFFDVEASEIETDERGQQWLYVVVVVIAEKRVGLVVEKLLGQEEVVIKSIGKFIQPKGIAGATIMGNGKVTLIVDLGGLMEIVEEMGKASRAGTRKKGT